MNRIASTFQSLKAASRKAVIPYMTPEYPVRGCTVPMIIGLEQAGANLIEVGIPFSDPIADGPTIQHASHIAIQNGATIVSVLKSVKEAREKTQVPIILMGYINPIVHYGVEKFLHDAHAAGVDGLIVPDLPPEESAEYRTVAQQNGVSVVSLIAPTTGAERIRYLDALSSDFSYCVSVTGVTGARMSLGENKELEDFFLRVRSNTKKPFVVGFGISSREQVKYVHTFADGAVVGSALLQKLVEKKNVRDAVETAKDFLATLISPSKINA